ncbi:MAG: pyridoxal-phosphate dependent enzyme [Pseudomonadota bacterium]
MINPGPVFGNVLDAIGNTPMAEVKQIDTGPCRLFLKLENQNPGGSIKDRIGKSMIEAAEKDGTLRPGGRLIEATAGNTGLGLALVAAQKGYNLSLIVPDKMAQEKIFHLKALGTEVILTRSDVGKGHPEYYQDMAERIAKETGAIYVNQFENPANPLAHVTSTGPEIWQQMDQSVDAVVCGVGSGGTIAGLSRYFEGVSPETEMILADPTGSILAHFVDTGEISKDVGSWLVEGIGEDFMPPNADNLRRVAKAYSVTDGEAMLAARELLNKEGILAGSSSGTLLTAALRYCREQTSPKRVVSFVCDSGNKYLSKMFNDFWMIDQGLIEREKRGDLRDLITRRHADHSTVVAAPDDNLLVAYGRMKLYDISQLPVLDDTEQVVGIIDESDILLRVYESEASFKKPVSSAMTKKLQTVPVTAPLDDLLEIFAADMVAIVMDGTKFLGLITRIDLLNHLRQKMA